MTPSSSSKILLGCIVLLSGCSSSEKIKDLEQQVATEKARVNAYEARYGKLVDKSDRIDVRDLKPTLQGATKTEVAAKLGQPEQVFTLDTRECWTYKDRAFDALTDRAVSSVEFWFKAGHVDEIIFSY